MAEFALGLTKSAVEGTLTRVKSAIEEEARLKVRVQNDLLFITGEFQMMRSFLYAANAERAKNDVVRTWVRQVRELAFEVEDCVEFVVHLEKGSPWTSWFWRILPSCIVGVLPLDEAVKEINQLKARVEDVSQRNTRYSLISDSGSGSSSKHPVSASSLSLVPELMPASTDVGAKADAFDTLCMVWESTGKLRDMGDLCKLINNEGDDLEVISLWQSPGAGHLGVGHVIRQAYHDQEINRVFKGKAWIKLMHPFNPDEFLKSLLTQIYASSCHQANVGVVDFRKKMKEAVATEDELMQQLIDQRYLVIVEELSTVVEWDAIRMYLPDSRNGSRIVVATQQLGLALSCTGDPYQVSILRQLSDRQSLCAFSNKVSGRHSDTSEIIWQLRHPGVVSVWNEDGWSKSTLIDKLYTCITHETKKFDGVGFKRHVWVDIPAPYSFDMMQFCRRLLLSFHSDDFQAKEITEVSMMGDQEIFQRCSTFVRENGCLIVIGGLKSMNEWDMIKHAFLHEPIEACFLVVSDYHDVARYCVDEECQAFSVEDLDADVLLRHFIKDYEYYRFGGKEDSSTGRLLYNRREKARDWINKFHYIERQYYDLQDNLKDKADVISLWGAAGAGKSALARRMYYTQMHIERKNRMSGPFVGSHYQVYPDFGFTKYSWIEVPHPFDLTDLCWRLLLDFYSDSDAEKETVAVDLMYRRQDPVEKCRMFLREHKCFIVVQGLRSTRDWDMMSQALLSDPINGCIIVTTNEERVARYCAHHDNQVGISEKRKDGRVHHVTEDSIKDQRRYALSSRIKEARDWFNKFELTLHRNEAKRLSEQLKWYDAGVISVWGIPGMGKLDVVRSIYYPHMIGITTDHRSYRPQGTKYSCVDVPHPFNLTDLSRRLLLDFHSDDLAAKEAAIIGMMEGQDPVQECRKLMHQDKCFVVIRGLRSIDDWDLIKVAFLPNRVKGCILVITNEESIATHCAHRMEGVIHVNALDPTAAFNLFIKTIQDNKLRDSDEVEFRYILLAKCGGLPKVITAMGNYCKHTAVHNLLDNIGDGIMNWLETDPSLRGLFFWLQSYFDACPDYLKPSIFYLTIFPANQNIGRKRLLRRWIAEGYSRDTSGSSALENGEMVLSKLSSLSIIHQSDYTIQVNAFIREYIISRPMEDNLVFALERRCNLNMQRAGQHLTISSRWDRDEIVFRSMDLSRLRSLTVFGEWKSFFISDNVNMKVLRVLDLKDTSGLKDGDIKQIGKLLPRLKFLSLRGCICITRLPDSLGFMRQLQTLDIKYTSIVTLPLAIIKLQKVQFILAGTTNKTCDVGDHMVAVQPLVREDCPSTTKEDTCGNGTTTSLPPAEASTSTSLPPAEASRSTSLPPAEASTTLPPAEASTSLPPAEATTSLPPAEATTEWSSWPCSLVSSWLCKSSKPGLVGGTNHNGVKVDPAAAEGIGKLTALHTLGVVNVGSGGNTLLREIRKLTQLRKLRLSGINLKNWKRFCSFISGHGYLESLSVRLDKDPKSDVVFAVFSDISMPPKNLKTLKVYGKNTHISAVWIKQLHNLTKVDLELTISTQEDINTIIGLPCRCVFRHVWVRPVEDGELNFGLLVEENHVTLSLSLQVLKIDCRYKLSIFFGPLVPDPIELVVVHCSTAGSSLELTGLEDLPSLKEVWLTGSYSEELKQYLQENISKNRNRAVLKVEAQPRSSSNFLSCNCRV